MGDDIKEGDQVSLPFEQKFDRTTNGLDPTGNSTNDIKKFYELLERGNNKALNIIVKFLKECLDNYIKMVISGDFTIENKKANRYKYIELFNNAKKQIKELRNDEKVEIKFSAEPYFFNYGNCRKYKADIDRNASQSKNDTSLPFIFNSYQNILKIKDNHISDPDFIIKTYTSAYKDFKFYFITSINYFLELMKKKDDVGEEQKIGGGSTHNKQKISKTKKNKISKNNKTKKSSKGKKSKKIKISKIKKNLKIKKNSKIKKSKTKK